jgi:hypothetical protein
MAVLRERRDDGATPNGGAYSVTRWDDETGDADIVVGEMVTFDAEGRETVRRPLKHRSS